MSVDEGKEAAIRTLHAYRDELRAEIGRMQENLHHVERSIELLSGNGLAVTTSSRASVSSHVVCRVSSGYSQLKPQKAVQRFLRENPDQWFKASVVGKELVRRGMPKTSKAFASAITGALNRTVDKGLAVREKRNGVFMYQCTDDAVGEKTGPDKVFLATS